EVNVTPNCGPSILLWFCQLIEKLETDSRALRPECDLDINLFRWFINGQQNDTRGRELVSHNGLDCSAEVSLNGHNVLACLGSLTLN
ncbi:MAG TPA: hypothetical protein VGA10_06170, partial [Thermoanaerobaculia bacterium]